MTVARLGIDIDSSPAPRAVREIEKLVPAAQKAERAVDSLAASAKQDLQQISRQAEATGDNVVRMEGAFSRLGQGGGLQNVSRQFTDMAVQIGAGQSAAVALTQQLPQLLDGLGPIGAVMGLVAAVGVPLAASFMSGGESAQSFDDRLEGLSDALERAKETADLVKSAQEGLAQTFAGTAEQVTALTQALLARDVGGLVQGIADTGKAAFSTLADEIREIRADFAQIGLDYTAADGIKQLSLELGLSVDQTGQLLSAMDQFNAAASSTERNNAMLNTLQMIQGWGLDLNNLPPPMREFASTILEASQYISQAAAGIRDTTTGIYGAVEAGNAFAASMMAAAANAKSAYTQFQGLMALEKKQSDARLKQTLDPLAATEDSRTGQVQSTQLSYQDRGRLDRSDPRSPAYRAYQEAEAIKAANKARSAAESEAKKEANRLKREAESRADLIEGLETELNLIGQSDEARRISDTLRRAHVGLLDAEGKQIAILITQIERQKAEMERVAEVNDFAAQSFADLFTSAITGANSLKDTIGSLISKLGEMAIQQGFMSLIGSVGFGSSLAGQTATNVFGIGAPRSYAGGGYTGGGSRSGGLDGQGGFLAMLHPQETVTDHTRGGSAGGSNVIRLELSPDLEGRILSQAAGHSVEIVRKAQPGTVKQSVKAVGALRKQTKTYLG